MSDLCSFNIRGLNNKISFAKDFILANKLSLVALLETKVQQVNANFISNAISSRFKWKFNYQHHFLGRIWLGWDPAIWSVSIIFSSAQMITCDISRVNSTEHFVGSFVYAFNDYIDRRALWNEIACVKSFISVNNASLPWCLLGDFNVITSIEENLGGSSVLNSSISEFLDCIYDNHLVDLRSYGQYLTWWNSSLDSPVFRKLDRVLVNNSWLSSFPLSFANFLPRGLSDHSPAVVLLGRTWDRVRKPFQFFNHLIEHPSFLDEVRKAWDFPISGSAWFILTTKLKRVKSCMSQLNSATGNVHIAVLESRNNLLSFQNGMSVPPTSAEILEEARLSLLYSLALNKEEVFLKQKSRVNWLKHGDGNNKFFFNSCKNRWNTNKILALEDPNGVVVSSHGDISNVAVNYFRELLGQHHHVAALPSDFDVSSLSGSQASELCKPVTDVEILNALKGMGKSKSPGPDGFTVEFFLAAWQIVGTDVINGVKSFFNLLELPRIINATAVALVPKVPSPTNMSHFRPISCCNILYKCIAKILAKRMKAVMCSLVSSCQSAFVPSRLIGDNILLAQSLCHNYHLDQGPPKCAIKLDISKAFDSLNWSFLLNVLNKMGFPKQFIDWIEKCITSPMFSIKVNGALEGFFEGKTGLRQGDPISPYLFVIAMEALNSCLQKAANCPEFKFHWKAEPVRLTHLVFADDVLLFSRGDFQSVSLLFNAVTQFSLISGLHPSSSKSSCFFGNVPIGTVHNILQLTAFSWGDLPVKYLGLPLISSKLNTQDCLPLLSRIRGQIELWANKPLTFSGRLQLIKVVLYGILGFWSHHLFLPKFLLRSIQSVFAKFLWGGDNCQHKVSWDTCCLPKQEGGLGLKNIIEWNHTAIIYQIWRITQPHPSSLWLEWVQKSFCKGKAFWTMAIPSSCSWSLKKIFRARAEARVHMHYGVGPDSNFLLWHDPWVGNSPLIHQFDPGIISIMESTSLAKVREIMDIDGWVFPVTNHIWAMEVRDRILQVQKQHADSISWGNSLLRNVKFSHIWDTIRTVGNSVAWCNAIWHTLAINKCAFILWLAVRNRLLTRDRLIAFGIPSSPLCVLCGAANETHDHIFSRCPFIITVFQSCPITIVGEWFDLLQQPATTIRFQIQSSFVAVAIYLTWRERNSRIHDQTHVPVIASRIGFLSKQMVREKVFSCKRFHKAAARDFNLISMLY